MSRATALVATVAAVALVLGIGWTSLTVLVFIAPGRLPPHFLLSPAAGLFAVFGAIVARRWSRHGRERAALLLALAAASAVPLRYLSL